MTYKQSFLVYGPNKRTGKIRKLYYLQFWVYEETGRPIPCYFFAIIPEQEEYY